MTPVVVQLSLYLQCSTTSFFIIFIMVVCPDRVLPLCYVTFPCYPWGDVRSCALGLGMLFEYSLQLGSDVLAPRHTNHRYLVKCALCGAVLYCGVYVMDRVVALRYEA